MIKEKENILFYGTNKKSPAYKFYCQSFSKLEKYNQDSENRHAELMAKALREQRRVYISLAIIFGLGISLWFF